MLQSYIAGENQGEIVNGLIRSITVVCFIFSQAVLAVDDELDQLLGTSAEEPVEEASVSVTTEPVDQKPPTTKPSRTTLEEIVVTAQKRKESLQETPISIAAFNAENLETMGIDGLADLDGKVPGLSLEPFPTSNATLQLYIRGIGIIDSQITQDPAIGIYYDGIYISRSVGAAFDLADVERIEVLRGPQGTLYGRNTTGGAVNIVTKRPSTEAFSMQHKLTTGKRGQRVVKNSFNIPIGKTLAVKPAVIFTEQLGFMDNLGPGGDFGDREVEGQRLDLRWLATDRWILDASYDDSTISYFNMAYQAQLTPEGDKGTADLIKRPAQARSRFARDRLDALATGAPLEPSNVSIDGYGLTLTGDYDPFEIKYIASKRNLSDAFYTDLGGGAGSTEYRLDTNRYDGPAANMANGGPVPLMIPLIEQKQTSHEIQFIGSDLWDSVDFIAGLYKFNESATEDWPFHHQLSSPVNPDELAALDTGELLGVSPRLVAFAQRFNLIENDAQAIYGQATWTPHWNPKLHLTLGYRHSQDKRFASKTFSSDNYVEVTAPGGEGVATLLGLAEPIGSLPGVADANPLATEKFNNVEGRLSFKNDSWTLIGEYDWTDNLNVYTKYVEAYKSGGFNIRDPQISGESGEASDGTDYGFGFAEGFEPELVTTIETGIKSEWFDRRLRLNADIFHTQYKDMQINFLVIGTVIDTKTTNAGEADMNGLELDATWLASSDLLFNLSYAFLDAEITEVIDANGNNVANAFQFNSAPEHSGTLSTDWTFLRRPWGNSYLHLSWNSRDERNGGARVGQPVGLPSFSLLNFRIGINDVRFSNGDLKIALWGKNVLDEEYEINAIDNLPHADRAVLWGEPQSFGLDVIYNFGL